MISSTVADSFRFAGMEWDSEDGLNHTLYRKYTAAQGRWETPDPKRGCVSFPQGHNLYGYVKDNATNLVDPLGDIVMCGQGCSIYDGFCCSPCDPWLDPTCGTIGYPLPGTGGGGGGFTSGGGTTPPQKPCDPCSDPTCPGICEPPPPQQSSSPCKERSHIRQAIGVNLCNGDTPYLWWSWDCIPNGNFDCCKTKQDIASRQCKAEGGVSGGHVNNFFESIPGGTTFYGNCCSRKKPQLPPVKLTGAR